MGTTKRSASSLANRSATTLKALDFPTPPGPQSNTCVASVCSSTHKASWSSTSWRWACFTITSLKASSRALSSGSSFAMLAILLSHWKGGQIKLIVHLALGVAQFEPSRLRLANNCFANGHALQIALLLGEQRFFGQNLFQKRRQPRTVNGHPLAVMGPLLFAPFREDEFPFPLRASLHYQKGISRTGQPLPIHKGIGQANVEWIVPHLDALACFS